MRGDYLGRTHIGLDFFDASINRVAAWTIGARNMLRALCIAMLDPVDRLERLELAGDYTSRLALMEEARPCRSRRSGIIIASIGARRWAKHGWGR